MKFKLPRPVFNKQIRKIVFREIRRQKIRLGQLTYKEVKELTEVMQQIQKQGLPEYLVCKKMQGKLGYGIFLHPFAPPIEKGAVIASYAGEISLIVQNEPDDGSYAFTPLEGILLRKKEQAFFDKKNKYHPRRLYSMKVDALKKGNFTRFINHSYHPNIVAYTVAIPSHSLDIQSSPIEVVYFAKKKVYPGEQLLVSYEDEEKSYWVKVKPYPMTPKTFHLL